VNIPEGEHVVIATQTDPNTGVESDPSPIDNLIIDTIAPDPHTIDTVDGDESDTVLTSNSQPEIKGECETGTTVTAFIDGNAIAPTATCNGGEYSIVPNTEIEDGTHTVTTTDVDEAGNVANAGPVALTISTAIPNYKPTLSAQGTIVTGTQGNFNIVVRIADFAGGMNTGPVKFSIVKNKNLSIDFDEGRTEQQDASVQNGDWTLEETSSLYIFTYNGAFAPATSSKVGLSGTFTSPVNTKGAFALDVTVIGGNGETDFSNNKDTEIIEYNNLVQQ